VQLLLKTERETKPAAMHADAARAIGNSAPQPPLSIATGRTARQTFLPGIHRVLKVGVQIQHKKDLVSSRGLRAGENFGDAQAVIYVDIDHIRGSVK
jgi:hypothetical protein